MKSVLECAGIDSETVNRVFCNLVENDIFKKIHSEELRSSIHVIIII